MAVFDGAKLLGEVIADALGKWKLELQGLAPGVYSLTLKETTPEGVEMTLREPVTVTVGGAQAPEAVGPETPAPEVAVSEVTTPR